VEGNFGRGYDPPRTGMPDKEAEDEENMSSSFEDNKTKGVNPAQPNLLALKCFTGVSRPPEGQ